jgi:hypothetical protein
VWDLGCSSLLWLRSEQKSEGSCQPEPMLSPLHARPPEREREITCRREMAESVQLRSSGGARCGDGGVGAEIGGDWSRVGASLGQGRERAGFFRGLCNPRRPLWACLVGKGQGKRDQFGWVLRFLW